MKRCPHCGKSLIDGDRGSIRILEPKPALKFKGTLRKLARVEAVIIHHSGNHNPNWGVQECHAYHRTKWSGIGYNFYIEQSGEIYHGRSKPGILYSGAHALGWNGKSIGICVDGDYDTHKPTEKILNIAARLTADLLREHGLDEQAVLFHRDVAPRTCPGSEFESLGDFRKRVKRMKSS